MSQQTQDELMQDLALKLDLATVELRTIDEVLARRPALDGLKHRTWKIAHACSVIGELLQTLEAVCSAAEAWHKETNHEDDTLVKCNAICACIPQMKAVIQKAKGTPATFSETLTSKPERLGSGPTPSAQSSETRGLEHK